MEDVASIDMVRTDFNQHRSIASGEETLRSGSVALVRSAVTNLRRRPASNEVPGPSQASARPGPLPTVIEPASLSGGRSAPYRFNAAGKPEGRLWERRRGRVSSRAARAAAQVQKLGGSSNSRLAHELESWQRGDWIEIMHRLVCRLGGLGPLVRLLDGPLVCHAAKWGRHTWARVT